MDWSKAKTFLIALLACLNVFLIVTYIMRENEVRNDEFEVRNNVCNVLASQGIIVAEENIPLDSVEIHHAVITGNSSNMAIAERLFGEVKESVGEDVVTYVSERGNIMFSKDSFTLMYESGNNISDAEEAKTLAKNIAQSLNVLTEKRDFTCEADAGVYKISVPQFFSGIKVFDGVIEFTISESGSVIANGKYIGYGKFKKTEGKVRRTSALLLDFADRVRNSGVNSLKIEKTELGYFSKYQSEEVVQLAPMLRITTDYGVFGVDMATGQTEKL